MTNYLAGALTLWAVEAVIFAVYLIGELPTDRGRTWQKTTGLPLTAVTVIVVSAIWPLGLPTLLISHLRPIPSATKQTTTTPPAEPTPGEDNAW